MGCKIITGDDGKFAAVICSRGQRQPVCATCGKPSRFQCDFPLEGPKAGRTCDAHICAGCRVNVGQDKDYCPVHARMTEATS